MIASAQVIEGLYRYLVSEDGPVLTSDFKTIQKFVPNLGRMTHAMPLCCVHVVEIGDDRLCFTGGGGVRKESYRVATDVFCHVTATTAEAAQDEAEELIDMVRAKLVWDFSWGATVVDGSAHLVGRWLLDPLEVTIKGLQYLGWRWETSVLQAPLAS